MRTRLRAIDERNQGKVNEGWGGCTISLILGVGRIV